MGILMTSIKKVIIIQRTTLGLGTRSSKISRTLMRGGYDIIHLGWNKGFNLIDLEKWGNCRPKEIELKLKAPIGIKVALLYPIWWCFIFMTLMIEKWDIAHAIDLESAPPAIIAGKLRRKPVIYDIMDIRSSWDNYDLPMIGLIRRLSIFIDKIFMHYADCVMLVDELQPESVNGIPNDYIAVIYDSPEDRNYAHLKNESKNKFRDNNPKFTLFYGGVLSSSRELNLDKAFNAIKDLKDVKLIIAGYGDLVNEISELEAKRPECLQFIGPISHEEILSRTADADLLFLLRSPNVVSNKYICGSKFLEAMMCGKPILANKGTSTAIKVLQENCGIVVDAENTAEIREAIIMLKGDPRLVKSLSIASRNAYERKYSWSIMEIKLLDIYRNLLKYGSDEI
jgi:glycosyltransferase involved in cell wall biosynthesis